MGKGSFMNRGGLWSRLAIVYVLDLLKERVKLTQSEEYNNDYYYLQIIVL